MLIRGKYLIRDPHKSDAILEDGAVYTRGARIAELGKHADLVARYPDEEQIGSGDDLLLPGLVNAHDHGRAPSSLQLGIADDDLELWLPSLIGQRAVDPYLATAYAAIQQIESGVTTVLHSYYDPNLAGDQNALEVTIRAYEQAGLRAVLALGVLDRSPISAHFEKLLPVLPPDLQAKLSVFLQRRPVLTVETFLSIFRTWHQELESENGRIKAILGPVSAHWCSRSLLDAMQREAEALQIPIQIHLLETRRQRDRALKRHGVTAVAWLHNIGFLSPLLSCAHCVWVSAEDIELLAQNGASVVHNPGSNLRLHSGIAPVSRMLQNGVNVALGTDSLSFGDDGDLLEEMRLAAYLQRASDAEAASPTPMQMLAMATTNGAQALGLAEDSGVLAAGKKADLILLSLDRIRAPFADSQMDVAHLLLSKATAGDVHTVVVDGQLIMHNRKILLLDKEAIASELRAQLSHARSRQETENLELSRLLKPYARKQFQGKRTLLPGAPAATTEHRLLER